MTKTALNKGGSPATGPRTPEGRARVSQNARKHGLTRASPDTAAITALVDSWQADPQMHVVSRATLWRFAQESIQITRAIAHQASILEQLIGNSETFSRVRTHKSA
jgi:hypothetical protein